MAFVIGVVALVIGCLLGWAGRYLVIEPHELQALCAAALAPGWCAGRAAFIDLTFQNPYGPLAVAAAAVAWVTRRRTAEFAAVIALFAAGLGLYLYDTNWAASALIATLLRLPRIGEEAPDPREFTA
jgi:hypothetical protein